MSEHGRSTSDGSSPPQKGCSCGVSTSSRQCFQCVNPRPALREEGRIRLGQVHRGDHYALAIPMTRTDSTLSDNVRDDRRGELPRPIEPDRIASLRGATVQFNPRRALQVITAGVLGALLVVIVVLTVAGIGSNNQIDDAP